MMQRLALFGRFAGAFFFSRFPFVVAFAAPPFPFAVAAFAAPPFPFAAAAFAAATAFAAAFAASAFRFAACAAASAFRIAWCSDGLLVGLV